MSYRISRNVEASFIDYLTTQLTSDGWTGIRITKAFAEVYEGKLPCICILSPDRPIARREIGSNSLTNEITIEIRIFATNDGLRLDLSDYLVEKLMPGLVYYEYTITNGVVSSKVAKGRLCIVGIPESRKEFINIEGLADQDKFRHIITLDCRVAKT